MSDIQSILDGTTNSINIHGWTLIIDSQFFFFPECFNEGVWLKVSFEKTPVTPWAPSSTTTSETWSLETHTSTGATGMFVNNITIGMTTEKRSIKWAAGVGLQVLPTSGTKISSEELLKSSTETSSTDLNITPVNNIDFKWYEVKGKDWKVYRVGFLDWEGSDQWVEYFDKNWQPKTWSLEDFANEFKDNLDQSTYDSLTWNTSWSNNDPKDFVPPSFNRIWSDGNSTQDMTNFNATSSLQDPNTTNRNPTQQRNRKWRSRPI